MALFKRLRRIFGAKWDAQFSCEAAHDDAVKEWGIGLAGLSAEQIKRGIDLTRVECEWPPSIAQFIKLAKRKADCWEHAGKAYRLHVRALPKPRPDPAVVRCHFAAMRAVLR